jgi:DNA mismatch endonuclease (patch repair protein)
MAGIRSKDTKPEMIVRRGLHGRGFRFRLHDRALPGCPDLILPRYKAVIFVHGCFWHGHDCPLFKWPRSRADFWKDKITYNIDHDQRVVERLQEAGWRVLTVWECAFRGRPAAELERMLDKAATWITSSNPRGDCRGERYGHR